MTSSSKTLLFTLLLAALCLSTTLAVSQGNDNNLHSVIVNTVRGRLTTAGNATTVNEEPPCDPTTNACMDWCGEVVRRRGRCPGTQMCCVLIY